MDRSIRRASRLSSASAGAACRAQGAVAASRVDCTSPGGGECAGAQPRHHHQGAAASRRRHLIRITQRRHARRRPVAARAVSCSETRVALSGASET